MSTPFTVHPGLAESSRFLEARPWRANSSAAAIAILLAAALLATLASVLLDFRLRIPGHAILRSIVPMALGLSLAPRRLGGTMMGAASLCFAWGLTSLGNFQLGSGAATSLVLTGPCLDVALWRARSGWRTYLAFAAAGLGCNLASLTVRAATKYGGLDHLLARPFAAWWGPALGTYTLCGLVAGFIAAAAWFRWSSDPSSNPSAEPRV